MNSETASSIRLRTATLSGHGGGRTVRVAAGDAVVRPRRAWYIPLKGLADFLAALVLSVLLAPVTAVAAVLVRLGSPGPAFYSQTRVGRAGREFTLYKLRTMVHDAEKHTGAVWSTENDPRITPIGRVLRVTHVDEFPQLVNVLLGQMSLVGPRPERPQFVDSLELNIDNYRQRLNVRPGVTGLAQVKLPSDTDLESVKRKLALDLHYIEHAGPGLDMRIVLATAAQFICANARLLLSLFRLPESDDAELTVPGRDPSSV